MEGKLDPFQQQLAGAKNAKEAQDQAKANYAAGRADLNRIEATGVNLSCYTNNLKCQSRLTQTALRRVASRNCMEIGGVWIDEGYNAKTPTLQVKAQSDAYFQMLEKHPEMKEVFQLGNHLVWMAPSGTAVVIDTKAGTEKLSDAEIEKVFAKK
jgi:Ca-activated chloride channel family protein